MDNILFLPILIGFFTTLFLMRLWIKKTKQIGLVWEDMNKKDRSKNVAGSGGIIVLMAFVLGVLIYVSLITFYFKSNISISQIFALLTTVVIASMIGFVDDIFGWVHGGLPAWSRVILLLFASVPLMVINAGESIMMGISLGLLYPLVAIPLGIIGATTTFNFLAGYNGLETSQGILILSALALVIWVTGNGWLSLILLIMIACLAGFYIFNKYPAKVFPGDVFTYSVGSLIAVAAILGNVEKVAIFFFIPYILEMVLKLRGNLKKQSFGRVLEDGSLDVPYEKFYGLEHIAIYVLKKIKKDGRVHEKDVVQLINAFQIVIIIIGLVLFRGTIF